MLRVSSRYCDLSVLFCLFIFFHRVTVYWRNLWTVDKLIIILFCILFRSAVFNIFRSRLRVATVIVSDYHKSTFGISWLCGEPPITWGHELSCRLEYDHSHSSNSVAMLVLFCIYFPSWGKCREMKFLSWSNKHIMRRTLGRLSIFGKRCFFFRFQLCLICDVRWKSKLIDKVYVVRISQKGYWICPSWN